MTRQSPTESATSFPINTKRRGNDKNMWIVTKTSNNVKRWKRFNNKPSKKASTLPIGTRTKKWIVVKSNNKKQWKSLNSIHRKLVKKNYKWWIKLSNGQLIAVNKNNKYKFIKSTKKSSKAKINDITKQHIYQAQKDSTKYIIWSGISIDAIEAFITRVMKKTQPKDLNKLINSSPKTNLDYFIKHFKKYFRKLSIESSKDYTLKY